MSDAVSDTPIVQGWCPGAHRPMMSGDGLVVRVRPFRATLSVARGRTLCDLARRYGNGALDLTSRANLQIRGVAAANHPALLAELAATGLLDEDPTVEGHRNILMPHDWQAGDQTDRLQDALLQTLPGLPALPQKMGYALDTGAGAWLAGGSADFRFEHDAMGRLLLRADGSTLGRAVTESTAMAALTEMVTWFVETGGPDAGRMRRHLLKTPLPDAWQDRAPRAPAAPLTPGRGSDCLILGAPFGSLPVDALEAALGLPGVRDMRLMLDRLFCLRGALADSAPGFVCEPGSALLDAHACPGAPLCTQATVETRALARRLADKVPGRLHVSGCAKGCALARPAAFTLTGRNGRFDLVRDGAPWDAPEAVGLDPDHLDDLTGLT